MVSIIVCSVSTSQFSAFEENVKATIGTPFEVIRIDNAANKYSICSAYNAGAAKAKFDYLCFSHEDVIMRTPRWGEKLIKIFESNYKLGVVGIAGSTYKSYTPSGWGIIHELRYVNLIQHYKTLPLETTHDYQNPGQENLSKVVCVDGVWMCTRKEIAMKTRFDEDTFKGFHCYDLDFCLSVFPQHEVAVTFEILLEHLSEGKNDKPWVIETMKLHQKWKKVLPVNIDSLDNKIIRQQELYAANYFLQIMLELGFSLPKIIQVLNYNKGNKQIDKEDYSRLKIRIIKEFVKRKLIALHLLKNNIPA